MEGMKTKGQELERLVLAHRFLYYVIGRPVLPDKTYDDLEERAMAACDMASEVWQPGSDLASDYPPEIITLAAKILNTHDSINSAKL